MLGIYNTRSRRSKGIVGEVERERYKEKKSVGMGEKKREKYKIGRDGIEIGVRERKKKREMMRESERITERKRKIHR